MEKKPLVLITNDDGIQSPGLHALIEAVSDLARVLVVAPIEQQTNMGRGGLKGPAIGKIRSVQLNLSCGEITCYGVNGSPAQAVAHGLLELTHEQPVLCLSGINYGENLGLAFTCSGTLGAAFEADSFGVSGIAFSRAIPFDDQRSDAFGELDWTLVQYHTRQIVKDVLRHGMAEGVRILNVNYPRQLSEAMIPKVTRQAYMNYGSYVTPGRKEMDMGYQLGWKLNDDLHNAPMDSDIYAVHFEGAISITPMTSLMSVDAKHYHGGL